MAVATGKVKHNYVIMVDLSVGGLDAFFGKDFYNARAYTKRQALNNVLIGRDLAGEPRLTIQDAWGRHEHSQGIDIYDLSDPEEAEALKKLQDDKNPSGKQFRLW